MRGKVENWLWGGLFILVGMGLCGNVFNIWHFKVLFNGWWTLFIIIPCIINIIGNGFKFTNIIGIIIGVILFLECNKLFPTGIIIKLIFPCILIVIGINILFQGKERQENLKIDMGKSGFLIITSIFSGHGLKPSNEVIKGCNIVAVFGGVDLYVSDRVNIKSRSIPIFGEIDNKAPTCFIENAPTIYVDSVCIFGGIDIQ